MISSCRSSSIPRSPSRKARSPSPMSSTTCARSSSSRHPHVFGDVEVAGADEVLANWERIKRREKGTRRPRRDPEGAAGARARGEGVNRGARSDSVGRGRAGHRSRSSTRRSRSCVTRSTTDGARPRADLVRDRRRPVHRRLRSRNGIGIDAGDRTPSDARAVQKRRFGVDRGCSGRRQARARIVVARRVAGDTGSKPKQEYPVSIPPTTIDTVARARDPRLARQPDRRGRRHPRRRRARAGRRAVRGVDRRARGARAARRRRAATAAKASARRVRGGDRAHRARDHRT